jgi:hypothetical protein
VDPVPYGFDTSQLLRVDMEQIAGGRMLVSTRRVLLFLEFPDPTDTLSFQMFRLAQSARALVELKGWLDGIQNPVWEHPILGFPLACRYGGQVVPSNEGVVTEIEALEVDIVEGESVTLTVYGTQWVDGLRIYEVPAFAVRVYAGGK